MKKNTFARFVGALLNGMARVAPGPTGWLTFFLFGMPKRRKPKHKEADFLAKANLHYEQIGANRIAVYRWGNSGPVALLAHGWESNAGRWRKVATGLLRAGFQVVAVDAPAHGRSSGRHFTMIRYAGVLQAVLRNIGPVDVLIGHSVGGAACVWAMGQTDPALRPKRAVILAAFASIQYIMDNARHLIGASDALMKAVDDHIEHIYGMRIAAYSLAETARNLGEVQSLIIHDRGDRVTHFVEGEKLHAAWPGAQFWATEGFGHGLTAPEVVEAVLAFAQDAEHYSNVTLR
ncbi:MAG: alpha/beta hydrolase [Saprospiraceae bacterium]|jgi:pimeloyl-ACP methyl ester carboxylesterase|nr:alpha/beta hydrolase [Saprospiraceae bacterium]